MSPSVDCLPVSYSVVMCILSSEHGLDHARCVFQDNGAIFQDSQTSFIRASLIRMPHNPNTLPGTGP